MKISHLLIISAVIILVAYFGSLLLKKGGKMSDQNFETETFSGINNKLGANVYIIQGEVQKVDVSADPEVLKKISLKVEDGILIIDKKPLVIKFDSIVIRITMKDIKSLKIDGTGDIFTSSSFNTANDVDLSISGSGNIDASINTKGSVKAEIFGSGDINLKGKSLKLETDINGSGNVSAYDFHSAFATVNIDGSGDCEVSADSTLNVNINGSGDVFYKGRPIINTDISGSGEVQRGQ